jgi:hypothetical protein
VVSGGASVAGGATVVSGAVVVVSDGTVVDAEVISGSPSKTEPSSPQPATTTVKAINMTRDREKVRTTAPGRLAPGYGDRKKRGFDSAPEQRRKAVPDTLVLEDGALNLDLHDPAQE